MDLPQPENHQFPYEIISNVKHQEKENAIFSHKKIPKIHKQKEKNIQKPSLVLFMQKGCPYCDKVLDYVKEIHKEKSIIFKDIKKDKEARHKLIEVRGKKQVPCIFINDIPHYESEWIIKWLKENQHLY